MCNVETIHRLVETFFNFFIFRKLALFIYVDSNRSNRLEDVEVKDIAIGAGGLGLHFRAG